MKRIGIITFLLLVIYYVISAKTCSVNDFGAVADGKTINAQAIQNAADEASKNGGGVVVFSKGKYLTGSLILKSEVTLFLDIILV